MTCALCESDLKLIKAHAIPEAFFRELRDDWRAPLLMTNTEGHYPKKTPIGVYDEGILCERCEPSFDDWDNYGASLLLKRGDEFTEMKEERGKVIALRLDQYDYPKLKLFFVSVLWRASVSTHAFYGKVNLGPYESLAKEMISNRDAKSEKDFSIVLSSFVSKIGKERLVKTVMDPFPERWQGINAYRFYFGRICAYIKVDKRPYPESLRRFILRPSEPLYIVNRILETSNDVKAMVAVVKGARQ